MNEQASTNGWATDASRRERIERLIERLWVHDEFAADQLARDLDREDADLRDLEDIAVSILEPYETVRP